MLGPIDGRNSNFLDRFPQLGGLRDLLNRDPVARPEQTFGQRAPTGRVGGASMNVASQVSQIMQSIGGNSQDERMMQLIILLLVLMAMMQESQSAQTAASGLLDALGRGQSFQTYESVSITTSQITCQTQYSIGSPSEAPALGPENNLDTTA